MNRTVATIAALLAWGLTPAPARAQATLFDSDAPVRLRLAGDLKALVKDRDSVNSTWHEFTLTYQLGDSTTGSLGVELKTRGHWRRQAKNCDFPPLWLDFPRSRVEGTPFAGQNRLKLVTPCRPGRGEFREYVLREYVPYLVYNRLTPLSLRVRLATTTYVDTARKNDSLTVPSFLVEDVDQMAERNGAELLDIRGATFSDLDSVPLGVAAVFLYLLGGTDWSLGGLHNVELVRVRETVALYAVPYDFDWTGIVNTSYALPDPRLGIRTVRDRVYRGPCLSDEHWERVLDQFRQA
jgi:hypothetical protein